MDSPAFFPLMVAAVFAGTACIGLAYAAFRLEREAYRSPHDEHSLT